MEKEELEYNWKDSFDASIIALLTFGIIVISCVITICIVVILK